MDLWIWHWIKSSKNDESANMDLDLGFANKSVFIWIRILGCGIDTIPINFIEVRLQRPKIFSLTKRYFIWGFGGDLQNNYRVSVRILAQFQGFHIFRDLDSP